jgi:hypothetical protein
MAASAFKHIDESQLRQALAILGAEVSNHWRLNADFLGLMTKSEIEAVAVEVGIAEALGEKAFRKALTGKKDEVIKELLAVPSFQYEGVVPKVMHYSDAKSLDAAVDAGESAESDGRDEADASADGESAAAIQNERTGDGIDEAIVDGVSTEESESSQAA